MTCRSRFLASCATVRRIFLSRWTHPFPKGYPTRSKPLTVNLLTNYTNMSYWCLDLTPPTRPAHQVLQTPSRPLGLTWLPSRQPFACISYLAATLTKNRGAGGALLVRSAERPFVTSLLPYLLTSSFLLTRGHSA